MANKGTYNLTGVDCATCAIKIEDQIKKMDGVGSSKIDLVNNRLEIISTKELDASFVSQLKEVIKKQEPNAHLVTKKDKEEHHHHHANATLVSLIRLIVALALYAGGYFVNSNLFIIAYVVSGYDVLCRALRNLFKGQLFDEHFLMSIATLGALGIGDVAEAVAVMIFYQSGEYLQDLAVNHSRKSIANLIDLKIPTATVVDGDNLTVVEVEKIKVGDKLLIASGEKIAVDGLVVSGSTQLDTSAISGESLYLEINQGDKVISGSVNKGSPIYVVAEKTYEDSTVATILKLVEESAMNKAKSERFITQFARYYTPIVVALALLITIVGPIVTSQSFNSWFYRALIFLVISCPCALVISIPLGFFGGIGGLSRDGVLVKGGTFLQSLAAVKSVIFDKTGTLTEGKFSVEKVVSLNDKYTKEQILSYAASLESFSKHPIGQAIVSSTNQKFPLATDVQEYGGFGLKGVVEGLDVVVGSLRFIEQEIGITNFQSSATEVFIAINKELAGHIVLKDKIKEATSGAIKDLKSARVKNIKILSGDNEVSVKEVASSIGVNEYYHSLLPQDKVAKVEKESLRPLAFVGDGINDAPVLALSDVGIAMGGIGSDAAIEAADVIIMKDDLTKVASTIKHSRRTMAIIKQNIVLAIGVKVIVMILGIFNIATMWMAIFADTGVALLAVANSLRALRVKK
jgi:Cd2+/Zn2+-exporting ATPase